jgi:hypothetical protein
LVQSESPDAGLHEIRAEELNAKPRVLVQAAIQFEPWVWVPVLFQALARSESPGAGPHEFQAEELNVKPRVLAPAAIQFESPALAPVLFQV